MFFLFFLCVCVQIFYLWSLIYQGVFLGFWVCLITSLPMCNCFSNIYIFTSKLYPFIHPIFGFVFGREKNGYPSGPGYPYFWIRFFLISSIMLKAWSPSFILFLKIVFLLLFQCTCLLSISLPFWCNILSCFICVHISTLKMQCLRIYSHKFFYVKLFAKYLISAFPAYAHTPIKSSFFHVYIYII